jgi:triphosphatase
MSSRDPLEALISIEVELKLAAEAADLAELKRALAAMAPGLVTVRRSLSTTYYDTPDLALKRAGATLRVRDDESRFVQTVKTTELAGTNLLARGEWEDTVAENRPDPQARHSGPRLPAGVAEHLHPLFITEVTRETIEIEPVSGTRIEAAIDTGEIRAIDSGRTEPISEIELELEGGDPAALYDLALRLLDTAPLRIDTRSKSERGHRLVEGVGAAPPAIHAEPLALDPGMAVKEAVQSIGRACLAHLLRNEPAALAGRAEGIHQMRVAVRRLRSLLSAGKKLLPKDARRAIADELAGLAAPLGPARNLDVFASELLGPLRATLADEPGRAELAASGERARRAAYDRVREEIMSPRHTRAVLNLLRWFEGRRWDASQALEIPASKIPASKIPASEIPAGLTFPIRAIAPGILERRRREVRKRSGRFAQLSPRERHRLRIAVKKLRYTVELLGSLYDPRDLRRYVGRLKRVQEGLGYANDVRVAYGLVIELSREAEAAEPVADAAARLLAWHERRLAQGEQKLRRRLRRLNRAEPFWRS